MRIPIKPAASEQAAPTTKTDRGGVILQEEEQNENDDRDRADRDDLPVEISLRAFLNGAGDFLHPGVTGRGFDDGEDQEKGENKARHRAKHGKRDAGSKER